MDIHERVQQGEQSPGALLGRSIRKFGQNRRTVRRGGGVLFWSSSSSLTNGKICCCIFFVWKRRQAPKRPAKKASGRKSRGACPRRVEDIIGKASVRQLPMRVKIRNGVIERRAFERGWFDRSESRNGKSRRNVGASLGEGKRQLREAYGSNRQRF
jgi:hypothetical protein